MITAKFYETPDGWLTMELRGHAGWGDKGRDLVCAAVSALAGTLDAATRYLEWAGILEVPRRCRLEPGDAEVAVKPTPSLRGAAAMAFWTVQAGLNSLARSYPENVELAQVLQIVRVPQDLQLFAEGGDAAQAADASAESAAQEAASGEAGRQPTQEQPDSAAVQAHWRRVEGIYRKMVQEAESLREVFPDFDVRRELHNRKFLSMLRAGVDMASAYQAIHAAEILPAALRYGAEYARGRFAGWVAAGRPEENGVSGGGGVRMGSSVGALTHSDYEQICRRVERGEKISFG